MTNLLAATMIVCSAYCNEGPKGCSTCNGKWAKYNRTASGTVPTAGRTIACNFLPLGTKVKIEGLGERVVEDRLNPKFGRRIDVFVGRNKGSHEQAKRFGIRTNLVEVVKP